jgi:DNA polymerase-3 subunit alpha
MPDIDIDFCATGRSKVIDYVIEKYGRNSVTQIITFGTLGAKSVMQDIARALHITPTGANSLTLVMLSKPNARLEESYEQCPEFMRAIHGNETYRQIYDYGRVIQGLTRQIGIHAAGVVIGPGDLSDYVPLAVSNSKEGEPVVLVQYEGKWLGDLKLLKMDILGLNTLSIIKRTIELIKRYRGIDVDIDHVDLTDKKAFEVMAQGRTDGVFQLESAGMRKNLRELKPNHFEDIVAMCALYRPGPMQFIESFIKRKHGKERIEYDHPLVKDTLQDTYGVIVYQEQVMKLAREMGGLTGSEADTLRKAMGKKNVAIMNKLQGKFTDGAKSRGVPEDTIRKIWASWEKFAEYAFNKSHSVCYAFVAFQTAFLKAHYPIEFMTALLSLEDNPSNIPIYIEDAKKMDIEILLPTINKSEKDFTIIGNKILFGLNAVKNVGIAAITSIINEREANGEFTDFFSFVQRVDNLAVNKSALEALVMSGTLDELEGSRAQKFKAIENALYTASTTKATSLRGQLTLFDMMSPEEKVEYTPAFPDVPEWDDKTKLENEKSVLGFYLSGHPLAEIKHLMKIYANLNTKEAAIENSQIPDRIRILGCVTAIAHKRDKSNNEFWIVTLEDIYGKFEMPLFSSNIERYRDLVQIGNKLYIIGNQSTFNQAADSILKVNAYQIMPVEELKNLTGEIVIEMEEKDATVSLGNYINEFAKSHPGKLNVAFKIRTNKFSQLNLKTRMYITPNEDFVNELVEIRDLTFTTNLVEANNGENRRYNNGNYKKY